MSPNPPILKHVRLEPGPPAVLSYRIPGSAPAQRDFGRSLQLAGRMAADIDRLLAALHPAADRPFAKLPHVSFYAVAGRNARRRWRISYRIPGHKRSTERLGYDARKAYRHAELVSEILASVKARLTSPEEAARKLRVDRRPVERFVEEYGRHLDTKGVVADYRESTLHRLRESLRLMHATRFEHLNRSAVATLLEKLREPARGIKPQTINYYLRAVKQFSRWMARKGHVAADPLQYVSGVQTAGTEDRRRDATVDEVRALYVTAIARKRYRHGSMRGQDLGMLILIAFCTGLRADELREARADWLDLGDRPTFRVPADAAKNRLPAVQPLPLWLGRLAETWRGDRRSGPLFVSMPEDMSRPFQRLRASARAAWLQQPGIDPADLRRRRESGFLRYRTDDGKLVFHSLRHGYASALLDSDAEAKLVQSLTRHSTITLLFDRYGHARRSKAAAAVDRAIPDLAGEPTGKGGA